MSQTSPEFDRTRAVAMWRKVLAVVSLALFAVALVWDLVADGFTSDTLLIAAFAVAFVGILWSTVLSHPTRQ